MQRRWINLGLFGAVAGLAALALWEPEQKAPVAPLLALAPEQIARIEVLRTEREALKFERQEGRWRMTAPHYGWANPVLINRVLEVAALRCPRRYPATELERSALRLDPPSLRLRLNDQEMAFGATAPVDGLRYLQVGATVHLCPDRLYPLLNSAAAGFLAPLLETSAAPLTKGE